MKLRYLLLVLLLGVITQVGIVSELPLLGIRYELLFSIVIFTGIKFDWHEGLIMGFWCGFFQDVFSFTPFGFSVALFSVFGFFSSFFQNIIFTQHVGTRLLILFIMTIASSCLCLLFVHGSLAIWENAKFQILSIAVVNTFFSVPLYILLDKIPHAYQS